VRRALRGIMCAKIKHLHKKYISASLLGENSKRVDQKQSYCCAARTQHNLPFRLSAGLRLRLKFYRNVTQETQLYNITHSRRRQALKLRLRTYHVSHALPLITQCIHEEVAPSLCTKFTDEEYNIHAIYIYI
jgi:hypothetical protein